MDAAIYLWGDVYFLRKDMVWKVDEFDMYNSFDEGYPKKIKDEFVPAIPNDVDAAVMWSDYYLYVLKGTYTLPLKVSNKHRFMHHKCEKNIIFVYRVITNTLKYYLFYKK